MRFGIFRLSRNHLAERFGRLIQITVLKKRYSVRKLVATKLALMKRAAKRKRFTDALLRTTRLHTEILNEALGRHHPLIDLDDHAVFINQQRRWDGEVSVAVEQETVNQVIDPGHLRRAKQERKIEALSAEE